MRNDPVLMHYGVKGMKWRKGRKTPEQGIGNVENVRNVYDERQKQIAKKRKQAANALNRGASNAQGSAKVEKKKKIYKASVGTSIRSGATIHELDTKEKVKNAKNDIAYGAQNVTTGIQRRRADALGKPRLDQEIVKGAKPPKIEFDVPVPGTKKKVKVKKVKY